MSDERAIGERLVKALKRPAIGGPAALALLLVIAFYGWSFTCPCERTPGAVLFGYEQQFAVDDWTFANEVTLCQIQINAGFRPHAINLNCFANDEGNLYLSPGPGCASTATSTPSTSPGSSTPTSSTWRGSRGSTSSIRWRSRPTRPRPSARRGPRAGGRSASGGARSHRRLRAGRPTDPAGVRAVPRRRLLADRLA